VEAGAGTLGTLGSCLLEGGAQPAITSSSSEGELLPLVTELGARCEELLVRGLGPRPEL